MSDLTKYRQDLRNLVEPLFLKIDSLEVVERLGFADYHGIIDNYDHYKCWKDNSSYYETTITIYPQHGKFPKSEYTLDVWEFSARMPNKQELFNEISKKILEYFPKWQKILDADKDLKSKVGKKVKVLKNDYLYSKGGDRILILKDWIGDVVDHNPGELKLKFDELNVNDKFVWINYWKFTNEFSLVDTATYPSKWEVKFPDPYYVCTDEDENNLNELIKTKRAEIKKLSEQISY